MARRKKVQLEFVVSDKKSGKVLYAYGVDFKATDEEVKSSSFAAALIYQEEELLKKCIKTRWRRKGDK